MASAKLEALEEVLASRLNKTTPFVLESFLFKEQLDFVKDPARYATAVCSVRSGKSVSCAADLINTALTMPMTLGLYITLARSSGKRIIWPELKRINKEFNLNAFPNESDLSMEFPNGSFIYCMGAGDAADIEKIRGLSNVALVYLDESQAFRSHIKELVEDIIVKRLYDTNGRCRMIGTPGPVPNGYFYEASKSAEWAHHSWTMHQNPWLFKKSGKTPQELIEQDCKRKGVTLEDPSIQRECFGIWILDSDSLVFKYDATKNNYGVLPNLTDYVIAIDLGSNKEGRDKDAIAVIGWHKNSSECYLVEEVIGVEEGISPLVKSVELLIKRYNPLKIVIDTGGLGAKIADELRQRHLMPIIAAEKTGKNAFIAVLNDGLRTSRFKAKSSSRFAQDSQIVEWDVSKSTSDRMVMKDDPHSDICDAVLYGYRECLHWLSEPAEVKVNPRDRAVWVEHTRKLMEENLQKQIEMQEANDSIENAFQAMEDDPFMEGNPLKTALNQRRGR